MAKKKNKVCIYAIAKNEAKQVDEWLERVKEADCVCVLDTGSQDNTFELLEAAGVKVKKKTYKQFRFDQARDDALECAKKEAKGCNIFFTIDMDERLNIGWSKKVRELWDDSKHSRGSYSYYYGDGDYEISRNWMHNKDWHWIYPCHEAMQRDGSIWYKSEEALDLHGIVEVRHYQDHGKSRGLYLDLLILRYKEFHDGQSFIYLMREYWLKHDWANVKALAKEIDIAKEGQLEAAYIYLGDMEKEQGHPDRAAGYYYDAIKAYPKDRAPYIRIAPMLIDHKQAPLAKRLLLEGERDTVRNKTWTWCDTEPMWTYQLYDWLCVACFYSEEYKEALFWAERALKAAPGNEHVIFNLDACKAKLNLV